MSKQSPHFFAREDDGSVRLRIRFLPDEASMIEEAAGATPLMTWIHQTLSKNAKDEVARQRESRNRFAAPYVDDIPPLRDVSG